MDSRPIAFIAFEEQDNLGVGYVASVLIQDGFTAEILDFRLGPNAILQYLRNLDPLAVGFSVIFQHYIDDFRDLIQFLRQNGLTCHFTAGGHYPSLRYEQLLDRIPGLDTVVLFEGEITFLELVRSLAQGADWHALPGLAFRREGSIAATPLRPLELDLDRFPPPIRQPLTEYAYGKKFATLTAGRGCFYACAFCSIREFYSQPPGPVKRVRRPEMVVREMELLHQQRDCWVFMFQDDDFPITYQKGTWLADFCRLMDEAGLSDKVLWKISCRPDEVDRETFAALKTRGLFLVYLGIESGVDEDLQFMNKRTSAATNLAAAAILKEIGILVDYGFMLFDPSSTFEIVSRNLDFLDEFGGDGSTPVTFCKMVPYAGTQVERQLLAEGRLEGPVGGEDYRFLDPGLDLLYWLMANSFADWIGDHTGLLNQARWVRYYIALYCKYYPSTPEFERLAAAAQGIISQSNLAFTRLTRRMLDLCREPTAWEGAALLALQSEALALHTSYQDALGRVMLALESLDTRRGSKSR
jgi:anaerobic magnesium-protoporphyrin IX monomethyl ester cyclase